MIRWCEAVMQKDKTEATLHLIARHIEWKQKSGVNWLWETPCIYLMCNPHSSHDTIK